MHVSPPPTTRQDRSRRSLAGLAPLGASCLWGGMYVVSRASFGAIPPVTLGLLRLLLGGAALWLVLRLAGHREPLPRQERWRLPLLGLCIAATITTQFVGTDLASAHDGALLTTITPLFIVPLAWLLLGERPQWRVVAGTTLALVGVVIIVGSEQGSSSSAQARSLLIGDGLLIISAFCWALFTVLGTPLVRKHSALVVTTYGTLWSLVFFAPLALWELSQHPSLSLSPGVLASVLYLGLGATALAWFLWYRGVERLPAGVAAIFFFAQPLVGGLLSALVLQEALGPGFWLGGLVLALGIMLASL
ncbi:DMT family transporter [Thermogemmatispora carboxidivorans]|uniref:DMT family transporter n=1 Tax=Thermogemmatispora carboxidivorans TaxID=1382306 RepID=UPI002351C9C6|nr:EamA family transporter [Thermogemmatispora carboxidivorans]